MWADTRLALLQAEQKREELRRLYVDANRGRRQRVGAVSDGRRQRRLFLRLLPLNR